MAKSTGNLTLVSDLLRETPARRCGCCCSTGRPVSRGSSGPNCWPRPMPGLDALFSAAGRPGSSAAAEDAVTDRLLDDLDVSGALDIAVTEGGDVARSLVRVLALGSTWTDRPARMARWQIPHAPMTSSSSAPPASSAGCWPPISPSTRRPISGSRSPAAPRARSSEVRAGLPAAARDWPVLVADSRRPGVAGRARRRRRGCVVTTVGPYARYGLPLVEACAAGRHALRRPHRRGAVRPRGDRPLRRGGRGERRAGSSTPAASTRSRRTSAALLLARARRGGRSRRARPSPPGRHAARRRSAAARSTRCAPRSRPCARTRRCAASLADPYALSPDRAAEPDTRRRSATPAARPATPTRPLARRRSSWRRSTRAIVRRSNALQGWRYGRGFRYREVMGVGLRAARAR